MKASIWVGLTSLGMAASGILLPALLGGSNSERWRPVAAVDEDPVVLDEPPGRMGQSLKPQRSLQQRPVPTAPQPRARQDGPWLVRIADQVTHPLFQRTVVRAKWHSSQHRPRSW